jgi:hypothetical protein
MTGFADPDAAGTEIPDPYGGEVAHYRETAALLASLMPAIVERLGRERRR